MQNTIHLWRWILTVLLGLNVTALADLCIAAPVEIRFPEGVSKGFLVLRDKDGELLAEGEVSQAATGAGRVVNRMLFRFKDGSVHDESVTFSQNRMLKLLQYQLEQKGPAFPQPVKVTLNGETGAYTVREGRSSKAELKGRIHLPSDVYNGLTITVLKNLPSPSERVFHLVAFDPEATVYKMVVSPVGTDEVEAAGTTMRAVHYKMKPVLGWWMKTLAWITKKTIPEYDFWVTNDSLPAFVRFEGALYDEGPSWRILQAVPKLAKE
jgi:hypothetical protein